MRHHLTNAGDGSAFVASVCENMHVLIAHHGLGSMCMEHLDINIYVELFGTAYDLLPDAMDNDQRVELAEAVVAFAREHAAMIAEAVRGHAEAARIIGDAVAAMSAEEIDAIMHRARQTVQPIIAREAAAESVAAEVLDFSVTSATQRQILESWRTGDLGGLLPPRREEQP